MGVELDRRDLPGRGHVPQPDDPTSFERHKPLTVMQECQFVDGVRHQNSGDLPGRGPVPECDFPEEGRWPRTIDGGSQRDQAPIGCQSHPPEVIGRADRAGLLHAGGHVPDPDNSRVGNQRLAVGCELNKVRRGNDAGLRRRGGPVRTSFRWGSSVDCKRPVAISQTRTLPVSSPAATSRPSARTPSIWGRSPDLDLSTNWERGRTDAPVAASRMERVSLGGPSRHQSAIHGNRQRAAGTAKARTATSAGGLSPRDRIIPPQHPTVVGRHETVAITRECQTLDRSLILLRRGTAMNGRDVSRQGAGRRDDLGYRYRPEQHLPIIYEFRAPQATKQPQEFLTSSCC